VKKKHQKILDNMPSKITAHSVRGFRECYGCGGIGHKDHMVQGQWHTKCFRAEYGLIGVLQLPSAERGKFRLCDLSRSDMKRMLALPAQVKA